MATSEISGSPRKLALVIGISNYENGRNLPNAINDAEEISFELERIGFILHEGAPKLNPTCKEMHHALVDFVHSIKRGDMVLFYYAGHGIQWKDNNYLIPSDNYKEEIKDNIVKKVKLSGSDLKIYAINAQEVHNNIHDRHPFVTMLFLDCCRTYDLPDQQLQQSGRGEPIKHQEGLTPMSVKAGSLIVFACAPGTVANDGKEGEKNGLFTKHLLKYIKTPNDDIRMILSDVTNGVIQESKSKQIPHVTSILTHRNICLYNRISEQIQTKKNTFQQFGITVAGRNGKGQKLNQLYNPEGIFIDNDKSIYVADSWNDRIVKWKLNSNTGQIIAGENGSRNQDNQLNGPRDIIFDKENNSFIISDREKKRVIRYFGKNQTNQQSIISDDWYKRIIRYFDQSQTNQQIIISNINCYGLTIDKNGSIYVSDCENHEVRRWKQGDTKGELVAGGNGKGNHLNQLYQPTYIFIDKDYSLYISDCWNHRVMKWKKDAKEGIIVAGGNGKGNSLKQLSYPRGVIVDHLGQIYVADSGNHRVMRWCEGDEEGEIVVGGNGWGNRSNQLNSPYGLSFDDEGNLYVADHENNRIQKYEKLRN
ncbi:unnamed protein product [Adineta steineri]|uniref:Peptidase C14 caspase domain-containing protein n=1 Tax=Adineta steineri TaxID=433720 RepID=A0A815DG81_9BILA|nr:unnamed protein product [Adineta steineri]CAF1296623.1 unnamed protein product [Adineta steineri]